MLKTIKKLLGIKPEAGGDKPDDSKRSSHWPAVRAAHLKAFPTCAACGGTEDLEVHHCKPFHLHPDLELVDGNLITLCEKSGHDCHYTIGHLLSWKAYNPAVRQDAAAYLAKVKARLTA